MADITPKDVVDLINRYRHDDVLIDLGTSADAVDEYWIRKEEDYIGLPFTDSYKWFLHNYSCGSIGGYEIYSVYGGEDFATRSSGDIAHIYTLNQRNKFLNEKQLEVYRTDFNETFYFDYTQYKDNECPIYVMYGIDESEFYAKDFYEFLYKIIHLNL